MACRHNYRWCCGWKNWAEGEIRPCPKCIAEMKEEIERLTEAPDTPEEP